MSKSFGNGEKNLWVPTQKHDFQALKWWPDAVGMALLSVLCQFGTVLQETIYGHIVKIKFEDRAKTYLPTVFFSRKGNYDYNIQCWDFNCTMFAVNKHKSRSNVWRTHGSVRILRFKRFSNLPLSEKKKIWFAIWIKQWGCASSRQEFLFFQEKYCWVVNQAKNQLC